MEIDNIKDNMELLQIQIDRFTAEMVNLDETWDLRRKELEINIRKAYREQSGGEYTVRQLKDKRKWIQEEIRFFLEAYESLVKVEPLKPFDDLESQTEMWNARLLEKINLKMLLQSPLDIELAETILALPDKTPVKDQIIHKFESVQREMLRLKEEMKSKMGV